VKHTWLLYLCWAICETEFSYAQIKCACEGRPNSGPGYVAGGENCIAATTSVGLCAASPQVLLCVTGVRYCLSGSRVLRRVVAKLCQSLCLRHRWSRVLHLSQCRLLFVSVQVVIIILLYYSSRPWQCL
jgi:hypothetical protein